VDPAAETVLSGSVAGSVARTGTSDGGLTVLELGSGATITLIAVVAAGSAAQAVTGFGFSLVAVPVVVWLVGPVHAVQLVNEVAVGVNLLLLARHRRTLQLSNALRLLAPALVVAPLAAFAVHRSDPAALSVIIGGVIVTCAVILGSGRRAVRLQGRWAMTAAGALSAAMNTAGSAAPWWRCTP
jgi:uncharacterized membrane protein YfcA